MRLTRIIILGIAILDSAKACETDDDCSLNGICGAARIQPRGSKAGAYNATRECNCDPGWFGDDCGRLDLVPATRGTGYNWTTVKNDGDFGSYGNSSWCGAIIQDPKEKGLFHIFTSQFAHGCGLSGWRPSSFIVRAESRTGPQGPYHYADAISKPFRHNTYAFYSPADEKYLLYSIGVDAPEATKCQSLSYKQWPNNISVSSADDPRGPWTPFEMILSSLDPQSTNPAPWPLWTPEDPTNEIALGIEDDAIFLASQWNGSYELLHTQHWNTSEYSPTWTEDPFLWRDKRGNWHFLAHYMIDLVEHSGQQWPRVGAHMFARDLTGPWTFKQQEAFNSSVNFTDGSTQVFKRRERPKLFFSDDGEMIPLYLVTGVQEMNKSGPSYTLVQPVGTKWQEFEKELGF
ncbi:hypothetical protein TruAng_010614 [Truncatella angustata]|nr:hypothetical protein TruAng_010614 [Truncatella angustata]